MMISNLACPRLARALMLLMMVSLGPAHAQATASPDGLIQSVTKELLNVVRTDRGLQRGDVARVNALVDDRVMPVVDFQKMTALTVGIHWRRASAAQQEQLLAAFRELLVFTYADALRQVQDATVQVSPARYAPEDQDVIVRTLVLRTGKEPIQLDYRLHKTADGWKIYDFNVLGLWLVEHYRSQFSQLVGSKGIDGLIAALQAKNKALRQSSSARGS